MANVTVTSIEGDYTVLDFVAQVALERGVAHPCTDLNHQGQWHLREGKTWDDLEFIEWVESREPTEEEVKGYRLDAFDAESRRLNYIEWREHMRAAAYGEG